MGFVPLIVIITLMVIPERPPGPPPDLRQLCHLAPTATAFDQITHDRCDGRGLGEYQLASLGFFAFSRGRCRIGDPPIGIHHQGPLPQFLRVPNQRERRTQGVGDRSSNASALLGMEGFVILSQTGEDGKVWVLVETKADVGNDRLSWPHLEA